MRVIIWVFILVGGLSACESKPKVIVEETAAPAEGNTTMPGGGQGMMASGVSSGGNADVHQVEALEILQAERYTYMHVVEKSDTFWIATSKMEAKKGSKYFYRGGLMKTNFESQEFKRVFDKIYLVSSIIDASAHPGGNGSQMPVAGAAPEVKVNAKEIKEVAGAIKLPALLKGMKNYEGKTIVVTGKAVKVNNGIMGRNWVHVQDGSKHDGKLSDLTVTTNANVALGSNVTFEGKIVLNKDFGAGYRYDILMEEGQIK